FLMSAEKRLRMGFSQSHVFRRHKCRKTVFEAALLQDMEYLITPCAGCDRERTTAKGGLHSRRRICEQHAFLCNPLKIIDALTADEIFELELGQESRAPLEQSLKAIPIIEGKVFLLVLLVGERESFFSGDLPENLHVDRIVICEDPIEVEYQRPNHWVP